MSLGTLLHDVLSSLVQRPATERYPIEREPTPERLHGMLCWNVDRCIGCGLCARGCPAHAIEFHVLDRKTRRFVLYYRLDRCAFCSQCVYNCPKDALYMLPEHWELAGRNRAAFRVYYGDPDDVAAVMGSAIDQEP